MIFKRKNKYKAKKTKVGDVVFDSKKEAHRYLELKLLQRAKEISGLELQPSFEIKINDVKICKYKADFKYRTKKGEVTIEDVKGFKTPVYRLKKKLMKAVFNIEIKET